MLDLKWGVLMAGIVVDLKTWNRIPSKYHDTIFDITRAIQKKYYDTNRKAEQAALNAMKEYGLTINSISEKELALWQQEVNRVSPHLRGGIISENIYDTVIRLTD